MTQDAQTSGSPETAAGAGADELFAHGLLSVVHEATDQPREERVRRVMQALQQPVRAGSAPRRRFSRLLGAGSVLAAAAAALVFLISPVTPPTYASFEESISVLRGPGDRRYTVTAAFESADPSANQPHATIDTRFPNLMLLQLTRPDGHSIVAGRDAQGEWAITPIGSVDRESPRRAWPGWAMQDGESVFADSIDTWLEAAAQSYTFGSPDRRVIAGREHEGEMDHMVGIRKPMPGPLAHRLRSADRVELWINPATKMLERMEMVWTPRMVPPGEDRPMRPGPRRPRDGAPHGGAQPEDGPREGRPGAQHRPPLDGPEDRPPLLDDQDGPRPPRPPMDGAPERGEGPRDASADGPMEGPPGPFREPGEFRPRRGPEGPGPEGGGRPGGPRPQDAGGARRLPLRRLIIDRTDAPTFADGWFSPDAHLRAEPDAGR